VLGSTGNIYTVLIGRVPSCDCPDHLRKSDVCKHLFFVYRRVLRLPASSALIFQRAFLLSELVEMLQDPRVAAEADPAVLANQSVRDHYLALSGKAKSGDGVIDVDTVDGNIAASAEETRAAEDASLAKQRRRIEEGDECPICFEGMHGAPESDLLWCDASREKTSSHSSSSSSSGGRAAGCGKALHADCARRWAAAVGFLATCPCCRAPWDTRPTNLRDSPSSSAGPQSGDVRSSGMYVNLGSLQNLPSPSSSSTFSPYGGYGYGGGGYSRYVRRRFY